MQNNRIFTQIMNLIERNTDMPRLASNIDEWLEDNDNRNIYAIYQMASNSRKIG